MKIKPIYRFFIWLAFIGLVILAFLAYYFQNHEKDLFLAALRSSLDQGISASDVDYDFPFGFSLDDFQIEGVVQAKKLSAQLDPRSFIEKKIILSQMTLHQPIITWRKEKKAAAIAENQNVSNGPSVGTPKTIPQEASKLIIKQLRIKNGRFHFADESAIPALSFKLDNLQMKIEDLIFPLSPTATTFQLKANLIKENAPVSGSVVQSNGWIDLAKKDLDGTLLIIESDGKTGLSAHAISKNNDLNVEGKIKAQNLFKQSGENPLETTVDNIVLNTLSNMGIEIGASFSFNTKLDDFRIEQISFSGSVSTHEVPATEPMNPVAP